MEVSVVGTTYLLGKRDDTGSVRTEQALSLLPKIVKFPAEAIAFERIKPLTDFRKCHDGAPAEARILFTCRRVGLESVGGVEEVEEDAEYIMKVKVQVPDLSGPHSQQPSHEPSNTTLAELEALRIFADAETEYAPHLVTFKQDVQGDEGLFPGGFVTYTVMTKMPGSTLYDMTYWSLPVEERKVIQKAFMAALTAIWALGVEPIDCALRNILWDRETKKSSIIDFELWKARTDSIVNEEKTLQRWGVARRPPPSTWIAEWNLHQ